MASALPPLYESWIEKLLGNPIPPEDEATCRDCAMIAGLDKAGCGDQVFFDSTTRCCTYLPELPNFLVGPILAETDPRLEPGRLSVEARLERRVAVTPLGLGRPATYALLYGNSKDGFGASHSLRCPHHLDDGSCGIWAHRMSVCATWFCKYSRGAVGLRFWRVLQVLLRGVERDLTRWCLLRLGLGVRELTRLFPPPDPVPSSRTLDRYQLDERVDPEEYAALWGEWAGREAEFFAECGRQVRQLGWQKVLSICGPDVQITAQLVRDAFAALRSREISARLRAGNFLVYRATPEATLVVSYNAYDPLRLPGELLAALQYFDGRPVGEALRAIAREKKLHLGPELIRKLVDFEVLLPAAEEGGRSSRPPLRSP